jgi:5'-phosphate synthase pdxT subunit
MISKITIGVLDIQGSVEEHLEMLKKIGLVPVAVKNKDDLDKVDGLIMPGGESTVIGKLLKRYGLDEEIKKRAELKNGSRPLTIWGTCAGAIFMAKEVLNQKPQDLELMDISISRNAYRRQVDSFKTGLKIKILGEKPFPAIFIRAPQINKASLKAKTLAEYGGKPIMIQQNNLLVTTFHPELTTDSRVHEYFIKMTEFYASKK